MARGPHQYQDFVNALATLRKIANPSDFPAITFIAGPSDYLLLKAVGSIKETWGSFAETSFYSQDIREYSREDFLGLAELESIFEPHSCYLLRHCEKKSDVWRWLAALPKGKALRHHFVFTFLGNPPPQKVEQDLKKLGAHVVFCYEPAPHEINKFILGLGRKYGLQLDASAVAALKESQGSDLFKLENELVKLSLIFADERRPLSANDLAPYSGMLREDHAFALDELLINHEHGKAQALLTHLLRRGEKPQALLGVLALHCRKALKVRLALKNGLQEKAIASQLRLPLAIVRGYNRYVTKTAPERFVHALQKCQAADVLMKSSNIADEVILYDVVTELAAAH